MPSDASERSRHARIAALSRSAQAPSGTAISEPARSAFLDKFYAKTDPELPEEERQRQARALLKLHMTKLSAKGVRARQRIVAATDDLVSVTEEISAIGADAI